MSVSDSLNDLIEAAPFIDFSFEETEAESHRSRQSRLPQLPLGAATESVDTELFDVLLEAHTAVARLDEACRFLPADSAPIRFMLMREAQVSELLDVVSVDQLLTGLLPLTNLPPVFVDDEGISGELEARSELALRLSGRVSDAGLGKPILTELASGVGCDTGSAWSPRHQSLEQISEFLHPVCDAEDTLADIPVLFENLLEYIELSGRHTDPLIVSSLAYHQFLAISPLQQNNRAAARLLWQLLIVDSGLLRLPILGLSEQIVGAALSHMNLYRASDGLLDASSRQNWLKHCLQIIGAAATSSLQQIYACQQQQEHIGDAVATVISKNQQTRVANMLYENPVVRIKDLVDADIAKRQTASVYLRKLCDAGVLKEQQIGKEKLFFNNNFLQVFGWCGLPEG